MVTSAHMGHWIPLTWLTLGLDYTLWGMDARGYHLTSLVFHAATAVAVFALACRLLEQALPRNTSPSDITVGAAAAALLFAVHPLRVESVAWVTERRDVVSGFFYVLTLVCYVKAATAASGKPETRLQSRWYGLSLACFAAALLSKSMAVTLPVALLVLDVYPLRRLGGAAGWRRARPWVEKLPFFGLAIAATAIAFTALMTLSNTPPLANMGIGPRLLLSVYGLAFYLFKTALPIDLSPLYAVTVTISWRHFAAVIAGTVIAVSMRRRWPAFTAVWLVYAITLLPVLGLVQNGPQAVGDRYSYLSCLGFAVLAGGAVAWRWAGSRVVRAFAAAIVLVLVILTIQQVRIWHDSLALWSHALAVEPGNRLARINLGAAYVTEGRIPEAIAQYQEVLRVSRDKARWYAVLGWLYATDGRVADALPLLIEALRLEPGKPDACANARRAVKMLGLPTPPEVTACPQSG
jgi:tetratricopeptide (TPR) repeat protein